MPTANLEMTELNLALVEDAVPGVYMAKCLHKGQIFKAAVSLGYNPYYDNKEKTLEAYLISDSIIEDFYGEQVEINLLKYLRPETWFDSFDALIISISLDI